MSTMLTRTRRTGSRVVVVAMLTVVLTTTLAMVVVTPARADPFPAVTFKLVNNESGRCAAANYPGNVLVGPAPCSTLDLRQQWTWTSSNNRLVNVGTGQCAQAFPGGGVQIQPCKNVLMQTWQRVPYLNGYRIARVGGDSDEGWYFYDTDHGFTLDRTFGANNTRFVFTMTLI